MEAAGVPDGCAVEYLPEQEVAFETAGGSCGTASKLYVRSMAYGWLPEAAKPGHDFDGWWTRKTGGARVTAESMVTDAASRTLYAHWKKAQPQTVWRFYSDDTRGHFFTISEPEKNHWVAAGKTWQYEGVAYHVYPKEVEGSVAVYRFWSDAVQHHFYTVSEAERDRLRKGTVWSYEGIAFWALPLDGSAGPEEPVEPVEPEVPAADLQTVWRFYSDVTRGHFFAISEPEKTA